MRIRDKITERCLVANTAREYAGVRICAINVNSKTNADAFANHVEKALEMIRTVDPRRFRRVTNELRFIINNELWGSTGCYVRGIRACIIDYGRYDFTQDEQWYLVELARLIVHEATHGHLRSRGIPQSKKYRIRVERVCRAEENRFSRRLGGVVDDHYVEFRPDFWNAYYRASWVTRMLRSLKRIREEYKKRKSISAGDSSPRLDSDCKSPEK